MYLRVGKLWPIKSRGTPYVVYLLKITSFLVGIYTYYNPQNEPNPKLIDLNGLLALIKIYNN